MAKPSVSKNARRRAKAKAEKAAKLANPEDTTVTQEDSAVATETLPTKVDDNEPSSTDNDKNATTRTDDTDGITKSISVLDFEISRDDLVHQGFEGVLNRFQGPEDYQKAVEKEKPEVYYDDDQGIPDEDAEQTAMSKKKRKKTERFSVAELKAMVKHPELVEWTDSTSPEPLLLLSIKSQKNVVPVPGHWNLKREYLSSKRGVEKPPFQLPKFIRDTGISEMRDAAIEKNDQASLKQRQRERVQGKVGKLDIDYQKLFEAFFRHQTKPYLTRFGEVYYEGKELEANYKHLRPGELSDELKEALSIPPGAPPPWLINMQRFGPPPSYPALRIAGLNAPLPAGGQWGFHAGGFGKPPLDENGRPLYGGDIHGTDQPTYATRAAEPIDKTLWGELLPPQDEEPEEEESDEDEEMGEDNEEEMNAGTETPSGFETPSDLRSGAPSEYDDGFGLGQRRAPQEAYHGPPRKAYQVIEEHSVQSKGFFGSDRAYDFKSAQSHIPVLGEEDNHRKRKAGDLDVSVDLDALQRDGKLSKDQLKKQYDTQRQESNPWGSSIDQEDLSQMIADESRKRLKKDEERRNRR